MLNALIDGIVSAIDAQYENYPIYKEEVEQDLTEPCFSVRIIKPTIEPIIGDRFLRKNLVAIHYFPRKYGDYTEINDVFETLFSILEYITVDGVLTHGTKADPRIEDGVGIFLINYDFFVYRTETGIETAGTLIMEGVEVNEE